MNKIQNALIVLIRNVVCGTSIEFEMLTSGEIKKLCDLAADHDMINVVAKGLLDAGVVLDEEFVQQLMIESYGGVLRYQQQKYAMDRMFKLFEDNGICYIPLKGTVIRNLYPDPSMRTSSDVDVLVKPQDIDNASLCLEEHMGGTRFKQTKYDVSVLTDNDVHIELHHTLISDKYTFALPLKNPWDYSQKTAGNRHEFTSEFFIYYHLAHMAKHLVYGGVGVRFVLDFWLMNNIPRDVQKLSAMLKHGGIEKMADIVSRLANVWFGDGKHDEETIALEEYILDAGVYGTLGNHVIANKRNQKTRHENLMKRVFMSKEQLAVRYPKVNENPRLYLWYLVVRFFRIMLKNRGKAVVEMKRHLSDNDEKTKKINKVLDMLDII